MSIEFHGPPVDVFVHDTYVVGVFEGLALLAGLLLVAAAVGVFAYVVWLLRHRDS